MICRWWPTEHFKTFPTGTVDLTPCHRFLPPNSAAAALPKLTYNLRPTSTDHHVFMQVRSRSEIVSASQRRVG